MHRNSGEGVIFRALNDYSSFEMDAHFGVYWINISDEMSRQLYLYFDPFHPITDHFVCQSDSPITISTTDQTQKRCTMCSITSLSWRHSWFTVLSQLGTL